MSQAATATKGKFLADSFSKSVMLISGLMVVQRAIGFLRSFYVCGTLSPAEVGRWDLGFSFLMLMAPIAVFGIPGSFGRYLPRYEANGQQNRFLVQTTIVCLILASLTSLAIWVFQDSVALYFFGDAEDLEFVHLMAIGLPAVAFFNFATSWFSGKRMNRLVFRIQFAQTLFFALLCVVLFQLASASAYSVVVAYLISCVVGMVLAAGYSIVTADTNTANREQEIDPIWRKIISFAVWVWISNALINLFSVCDRLLLVNFHPVGAAEIQSLVGQYHTACLFPMLLMTIGAMAGSTALPYLSKDWESGDLKAVSDRMNLMLKSLGLLCAFGSLCILIVAPVLFGEIWKDKFAMGEALLPMTLSYCSVAAVTLVAQKYFWCLEKTWISSCFLLIGVVANVVLGIVLVGPYGIEGVIASTLAAHTIVLLGVLIMAGRFQFHIDSGVYVIGFSLIALSFGKLATVLCVLVLAALALRTNLIFGREERDAVNRKILAMISRGSVNQ